jgi:D-glycerate 3-kinase
MDFIDQFIQQHQIPADFRDKALTWYKPMAQAISQLHDKEDKPLLIGINGCQGSGKTTVSALVVEFLERYFGKKALSFSLDDFYLPKPEREKLADRLHPLFATRGVPGTHDTTLLLETINALKNAQPTEIPVFNKALDDREFRAHWRDINSPLDIILIEGWCVGVQAQSDAELMTPINSLETNEDKEGLWRGYINKQLKNDYKKFNDQIDFLIMFKAPDFQCVYDWRLEQEHKLREYLSENNLKNTTMTDEQIKNFIQFFQRITEYSLETLPDKVDLLLNLDKERAIYEMAFPNGKIGERETLEGPIKKRTAE